MFEIGVIFSDLVFNLSLGFIEKLFLKTSIIYQISRFTPIK